MRVTPKQLTIIRHLIVQLVIFYDVYIMERLFFENFIFEGNFVISFKPWKLFLYFISITVESLLRGVVVDISQASVHSRGIVTWDMLQMIFMHRV